MPQILFVPSLITRIHALIHLILFLQKKRERESAVMRNKRLTEEQRDKWLKVMKNDLMSSEESGEDDYHYPSLALDVTICGHHVPKD